MSQGSHTPGPPLPYQPHADGFVHLPKTTSLVDILFSWRTLNPWRTDRELSAQHAAWRRAARWVFWMALAVGVAAFPPLAMLLGNAWLLPVLAAMGMAVVGLLVDTWRHFPFLSGERDVSARALFVRGVLLTVLGLGILYVLFPVAMPAAWIALASHLGWGFTTAVTSWLPPLVVTVVLGQGALGLLYLPILYVCQHHTTPDTTLKKIGRGLVAGLFLTSVLAPVVILMVVGHWIPFVAAACQAVIASFGGNAVQAASVMGGIAASILPAVCAGVNGTSEDKAPANTPLADCQAYAEKRTKFTTQLQHLANGKEGDKVLIEVSIDLVAQRVRVENLLFHLGINTYDAAQHNLQTWVASIRREAPSLLPKDDAYYRRYLEALSGQGVEIGVPENVRGMFSGGDASVSHTVTDEGMAFQSRVREKIMGDLKPVMDIAFAQRQKGCQVVMQTKSLNGLAFGKTHDTALPPQTAKANVGYQFIWKIIKKPLPVETNQVVVDALQAASPRSEKGMGVAYALNWIPGTATPPEDDTLKAPPTEDDVLKAPLPEDDALKAPPTEDDVLKAPLPEDDTLKAPPTEDNALKTFSSPRPVIASAHSSQSVIASAQSARGNPPSRSVIASAQGARGNPGALAPQKGAQHTSSTSRFWRWIRSSFAAEQTARPVEPEYNGM